MSGLQHPGFIAIHLNLLVHWALLVGICFAPIVWTIAINARNNGGLLIRSMGFGLASAGFALTLYGGIQTMKLL